MSKKNLIDNELVYLCRVYWHGTCVAVGAFATVGACVDWATHDGFTTFSVERLDA